MAFPLKATRRKSVVRGKRPVTQNIRSFSSNIKLYKYFFKWLTGTLGGGKNVSQANQIAVCVMKFLKFCCNDMHVDWEIPDNVFDYCLGSVTMISDFRE